MQLKIIIVGWSEHMMNYIIINYTDITVKIYAFVKANENTI